MSKPDSITPLRDEFEKVWVHNPNRDNDEHKEAAFGLFMAGVHVMLFIVPAKAENIFESLEYVRITREEVEAYAKLRRRKEAEQN